MTMHRLLGISLLMITAAIWGFAFVAQRLGAEIVDAYSFNALRFSIGALALLPFAIWRRSISKSLLLPGLYLGVVLFAGSSLQQYAMTWVGAGKAAFLTGLYLVLVPLFIGLLQRAMPWSKLVFAGVGFMGLYFLSIDNQWNTGIGDGWLVLGALFWTLHVILIDRWCQHHSVLGLAVVQYCVTAALSFLCIPFLGQWQPAALQSIWLELAYAGIMSVAIAYTLQIIGQTMIDGASAAVIMALEAAFAALGGWWLLNETLSQRQLLGCGLMMLGMLLCQIPSRYFQTKPLENA